MNDYQQAPALGNSAFAVPGGLRKEGLTPPNQH
jgi:hypothetical protein